MSCREATVGEATFVQPIRDLILHLSLPVSPHRSSLSLLFSKRHFRNGYPQAFAPSNMITIKDAPWLPSGHTMSIVKPALSLSETPVGYRLSTRPFGYDKVAKFLGVENTRDLVKDGDGWRFVGKQEGSAEARL